jgi:hypothetical protein
MKRRRRASSPVLGVGWVVLLKGHGGSEFICPAFGVFRRREDAEEKLEEERQFAERVRSRSAVLSEGARIDYDIEPSRIAYVEVREIGAPQTKGEAG